MYAACYERAGPADEVLSLRELPTPVPRAGEVRVRMACSGVNPSDVKTRAGLRTKILPFARIVPHSDGAGTVDQVGEGVDPALLGARVWLWNTAWGRPDGTAAQYVVLPAAQAVPLPAGVDMAAGACLGIPAMTACHALVVDGSVEGQSVLIAGGAGAVGHYAVQMAKLLGARQVIATVSGEHKAALARDAGADLVLNYRTDDLVKRCDEATGGQGLDRIVEVDAAANLQQDVSLLRTGGRIVVYGSGAPEITVPFFPSIVKNVAYRFFIVYNLDLKDRATAVELLTQWLAAGRLHHNIAKRLPLQSIAEAHKLVEQGAVAGNVVLDVDTVP